MCNVKTLLVVDCGAKLQKLRRLGLHDNDTHAVLVAAAYAAIDGINVDPILDTDSQLNITTASVIVSTLKGAILEDLGPGVNRMMQNAGDDEVLVTEYSLESDLIIINIGLRKEDE